MRRALVVLIALSSVAAIAAGCKTPDPPAACKGDGTVAHRDIRYRQTSGTAANLQSLDLYLPVRAKGCEPAPLVVYVHGGGFVVGDKSNQIAEKVALFNAEGWAFASINYRLVGAPGVGPGNGRYPQAEQDVAAAIAYLAHHAAADHIDPTNIMTLGHSSGAFLVALVATDGAFLASAGQPLGVIRCAAPLDTTYDIATQISHGGREETIFRNAFGDDPTVWDHASPPHNVARGKGIPAFQVITRGTDERVGQSQAFGSTLRAAGIATDVQVVSGLTHAGVNDAVGAAGETIVTPPLVAFFRSCVVKAPPVTS